MVSSRFMSSERPPSSCPPLGPPGPDGPFRFILCHQLLREEHLHPGLGVRRASLHPGGTLGSAAPSDTSPGSRRSPAHLSLSPVVLRTGHLFEVQPGLSTPHHRVWRQVRSQDQHPGWSRVGQQVQSGVNCVCVCARSCVFVWRLDPQMTSTMRKKRKLHFPAVPEGLSHQIRWSFDHSGLLSVCADVVVVSGGRPSSPCPRSRLRRRRRKLELPPDWRSLKVRVGRWSCWRLVGGFTSKPSKPRIPHACSGGVDQHVHRGRC